MKIRSVAVLGAGAVGAYILYGLSQTKDVDFCVVADGARKERLRTPQEARGADLLLVAVKYTALDSVLEDIRTIAAPGTVVLSLLNGIDSEEKIGKVIDPSQIVYSLMRVSSERRTREDGRSVITFDPTIKWGIYLGEKGIPVKTERIMAIEELFEGTDCSVYFVEDIVQDICLQYLLQPSPGCP